MTEARRRRLRSSVLLLGAPLLVLGLLQMISVAFAATSLRAPVLVVSPGSDRHFELAQGRTGTVTTAGGAEVRVAITVLPERGDVGDRTLTVTLTTANAGSVLLPIGQFTLHMLDGRVVQPSDSVGAGPGYSSGVPGVLMPGEKSSASLVFQLPEGAEIRWLKFDPDPTTHGDLYFDA